MIFALFLMTGAWAIQLGFYPTEEMCQLAAHVSATAMLKQAPKLFIKGKSITFCVPTGVPMPANPSRSRSKGFVDPALPKGI